MEFSEAPAKRPLGLIAPWLLAALPLERWKECNCNSVCLLLPFLSIGPHQGNFAAQDQDTRRTFRRDRQFPQLIRNWIPFAFWAGRAQFITAESTAHLGQSPSSQFDHIRGLHTVI
jgi:hypothetical protein